ncbi:MAG: hypothetical protein EHM20_17670, partial [Alphaproteobacteria bacterium]
MTMTNKGLNWAHLKALRELYETEFTKAKILGNPFLKSLKEEKKLIHFKTGNLNILQAGNRFRPYYESNFLDNYLRYISFFRETDLSSNGNHKYDEYDLQTLMLIWQNKVELKLKLTTVRHFSAAFFRGSKYMENHPGIKKAVYHLLQISDFPDKDPKNNQWRLVVDCIAPQQMVLCENLAFLKQPWLAHENNVELWYVGGNNVEIIEQIAPNKFCLPLFYSCDWDLAGLQIFQRLKKKIEEKGYRIQLLIPHNIGLALPTNSPYHNSKWR